jgi:Flp pilus assembly protein TadG
MIKKFQRKRENGQTMAEFTLVLPVLAILLFGVIQFGIVFNNYLAVTDAVRAGARQGAVSRSSSNPSGAVISRVRSSSDNLDQSKLQVSVSSSWKKGSDVTVSASYPFSINLLGFVVKSGRISSTTTERVE